MSSLRRSLVAVATALAAAAMLWSGAAVSNAAFGIGPVASAQETGGGAGARRGQMFAKMLMGLRPPLSDDQKARIRKMRDDMHKQYENQPPPADPAARRARFEGFLNSIRGVLTPAQQRDFDAKLAAMRARMRRNQEQH